MPAIQAYKHKGKIIPVDQAKKGRAYLCPWTGKIVANKQTYIKHLRELRATRMHRRARRLRWQRLGEDLWNQTSFENVVRWVELHPEWFLNNAQKQGFQNDRVHYDAIRSDFSIEINYLDLRWSESVSNSHSCPHNGVTNWGGRNENAPRGYPGWTGRIEYCLSHELPGFGDIMQGTRIHTGSGTVDGGIHFRYEVKFFADDWPGLSKGRVWETLKGTEQQPVRIGKSGYLR
jgi:hypothetical protein